MVSLRSIFYYKYDRSTLSLYPEVLEGRFSKGGSRRVEFLNFRHFSSLFVISTFYRFRTLLSGVRCIFEIDYSTTQTGVYHAWDFDILAVRWIRHCRRDA